MITFHENGFIEISPLLPSQFAFSGLHQREVLLINTNERKISSTHIFSPDRVEKYRKVLINFKKIHGFIPNCMILELVDIPIPTKKPVSTKTITHYLMYYNLQEINDDFNKLKQFIIEN
jgi:hypothetical protein